MLYPHLTEGLAIPSFVWSPDGPLPKASPHSVAKLQVISHYLSRYFEVLNANPAIPQQRITIVDGFCGGGLYEAGGATVEGTALRLIDGVAEAEQRINAGPRRHLTIDAQFFFNDENRHAVEALRASIAKKGHLSRLGKDIHLRVARFQEAYPAIKEVIATRTRRSGRSLFVLDQKGYKDAPLTIVKDILETFPGAEVILTFAVDWLIAYLTESPKSVLAVSRVGISEAQLKEYVQLKEGRGGRLTIQRLLLKHLRNETSAKFASPFFIRSTEANKDLWIVHLSNRDTARNVMVETHWVFKNHSWHPGQGGLEILGFDPRLDPGMTPDFWFGDLEQSIMKDRLSEDLMRRLTDQHGDVAVPFKTFIQSIANESPARLSDFRDVTKDLITRKQLRLLNAQGTPRRTSTVGAGDYIGRPAQTTLAFMQQLGRT